MRSLPHRLTRRAFSAGTLATLGLVGLPRRASAAATPKILIVGDSMIAGAFGLFLERALKDDYAVPVRRRGKSSSGLARPDFHDWHEAAEDIVAKWKPEASVVMFGGNDVQGLYMGKDRWIRWNEDGWDEEYGRRIDEFCNIVAPAGEPIYWVGMPVMRPAKFHARVQRVNVIYRARMAARPGATFVDTWSVLANDEGEYSDKIAIATADGATKKVRVRAGDGIHLSPAGANVLRDHVLEQMRAGLGIAPKES